MTMKAISKGGRKPVVKEAEQELEPVKVSDDDGLVMVIFPKQTWDKVQEMATRAGVSNPVILSKSLELLDEKMNEAGQ